MGRGGWLILVLLTACAGSADTGDKIQDTGPVVPVDADGDGYLSDEECDDGNPAVNPGEIEICDGVDNNCDEAVDEGVTDTYFADADADGFGDPGAATEACSTPDGYVPLSTDCDDANADTAPGQPELCDGEDNDCDDLIDEDATETFYVDADGDGYGDPADTTESCAGFPGVSEEGTDCDDADAAVYPGSLEYCNDADDDCDGIVDNEPTVDTRTWYPDADGDSYGDPAGLTAETCIGPPGYVANDVDCDDRDEQVYPDAPELCSDEIDQDCDGEIDEGCPVEHCGNITADESWDGDHVHLVTCDVVVGSSDHPILTIDDGAEVRFSLGTGLYVGSRAAGALVVAGDTRGVSFVSEVDDGAAGDWLGLYFGYNDDGSVLQGFSLSHGGDNEYGAVQLYGATVSLSDCEITDSAVAGVHVRLGGVLSVADCAITGSADDGITLESSASLAAFSANTLTGNGGFPITLNADDLVLLDGDSTYSGNGDDRIQTLGATASASGTWSALGVPYYITGDVTVQGSGTPEITVEDGVEMQFAAGVGLSIGTTNLGLIDVRGSSLGVLFTSADDVPAPGDWDGLTFGSFDQGSSLDLATVEYGGGNGYGGVYVKGSEPVIEDSFVWDNTVSGVFVSTSGEPRVSGSTVSDNEGYGVYVDTDGGLSSTGGPTFSDNTVTGNEDYGVVVPADAVGQLDDSSTYTGNGESGVRVLGGTVSADATWLALDEDYLVAGSVSVEGSARPVLTISAGCTLAFEVGVGLGVGEGGSGGLRVSGTSRSTVTLTSAESSPAEGDWQGVTLGSHCVEADLSLQRLTVSYGGGNGYGNLLFDQCDGSVSNATVAYSAAYGIYRSDASPTLTSITYTGNVSGTVY